jgi:hypothetical protein
MILGSIYFMRKMTGTGISRGRETKQRGRKSLVIATEGEESGSDLKQNARMRFQIRY